MASPDSLPFHRSSSEPNISRHPRSKTNNPKKKPSAATLSSALTEERLRDHTRRSASSSSCSSISPYYKGLTDSALYFKSLVPSLSRESIASSRRSMPSTVLVKIQEWGFVCFPKKKKNLDNDAGLASPPSKTPPLFPRAAGWDVGFSPRVATDRGSEKISLMVQQSGKPLRESVPAPAQPAPVMVTVPSIGAEPEPPAPVTATMSAIRSTAEPSTALPIGKADRPIGSLKKKGGESTAAISVRSKERDYVWAYKYRPIALKEFICNRGQAVGLHELVTTEQCSHFIFEGPPGVGKRTMVLALLRDVFGPENLKTQNELKSIELKGEHVTNIDVNVKISSQHIEMNLSDLRGYEKHVIAAFINESRTPSGKLVHCDRSNCRVIVLHEADRLSTDAQHYFRWLMEKYRGCRKIYFCCHDASKLQAIRPLCKIVKLEPPSDSEIVEVLEFIAKQEQIELPHHIAEKIAENSKHNLRQAIRSFEASWKMNHSFKEFPEIITGWEEDIANIAKNIVEEQSPKQLYTIRGKLKKLIEHDVSPDFIFNTLVVELKKLLDNQFQAKIDALYEDYNFRDEERNLDAQKSLAAPLGRQEGSGNKLNDSRKNIQHFMRIEAFTAKFMSLYKSVISKNV